MNTGIRMVGLFVTVSGLLLSVGCNNQNAGTSGSTSAAGQQDIGEVLAEVDGLKIGTKDFDEAYSRTLPRGPQEGEQDDTALKKEVIDRLVSDKLLYQEALRQGLDKDPKIQRMMINTLLRQDVYGAIRNSDISDQELQTYFDEHKDEFTIPEKVQVRRILIRVDDTTPDAAASAKANALLADLKKNPDSFKDVAIKESQDAYARRGGDIGFISERGKPGLDQKVVDEAFKLQPNQLSEAFKNDEGYNILQVVNRRERVERTFDQMKGAVLRKLKAEKSKTVQDEYVARLRQKASVSINEDRLKTYEPPKRNTGMPPGMPGLQMQPGSMPGLPPAVARPAAEGGAEDE